MGLFDKLALPYFEIELRDRNHKMANVTLLFLQLNVSVDSRRCKARLEWERDSLGNGVVVVT
jgi:hypothetical protein